MSKPSLQGLLTLDQLREQVSCDEVETVVLGFTDHYGRLIGKRFDADMFVNDVCGAKEKEGQGAHACNYLLTVDVEMAPVAGYKFTNWEKGYGDFHLVPDLATLRTASWLEKSAFVLCDVRNEKTHDYVPVAPRSILRCQIDAATQLGYQSFAASELEHYLYKTSYKDAHRLGYSALEPAGWYLEDYHIQQGTRNEGFNAAVRRHLKRSGVPVETSKGEWGDGQHEINVRYSEVLDMADRHVVFKQCMKELADTMGVSVTFMAKPHQDQAGSSCHIHFSLWRDGKNAFAGDHELGPVRCSDAFRWFLGGWMAHVPELMVFYAPTINSYKRFVDASWAPTRLAWSYDNRTAGFRVVGEGPSLRIECRIPGADCNPYLGFAAALASGLDGIRNKTEPPPCFEGDVYAASNLQRVPYTLAQAVEKFERSDFAKRSFGDEVVEHYAHFYRSEVSAFDKAVTDWERKRYFERI